LLTGLYTQWDNNATNPLMANEVAQEIWFILDTLIKTRYVNIENIALVGGDDIIPFYRVPDETTIANEADYAQQLGASVLNSSRPLYGSLFYRFIQTDNMYADRKPTPWRGRALFLPDLAIGRLVESPRDILRYLDGYITTNSYTIRGDLAFTPNPAHYSSALVTGYDFTIDEAQAIGGLYQQYGFKLNGSPSVDHALNGTLVNNAWDVGALNNQWFSGQLPQLTSSYNGVHTNYELASINGHFTHYEAIPANSANGSLSAARLLTPTAAFTPTSFFRDSSPDYGDSPTLTYSIGCHSGLSVVDGDIVPGAAASKYSADFPSAFVKQNGNWIGNTGFGYGDSDLIGYSERLALLFTKAIGRKMLNGAGAYAGPTIGESLVRAKREYIKNSGPGSFSVYDEKVIEQLTLYGLPFIRVKVPNPYLPPFPGNAFDQQPEPVPLEQRNNSGTITRIITFTNTFKSDAFRFGQVPRVGSLVQDSFVPGLTSLQSVDQMAIGRPVLPTLSYDITLQHNPAGSGTSIPQPRGVRLLSAITLSDISDFNPSVTNVISDQNAPKPSDPLLNTIEQWLPDQPYGIQRTGFDTTPADKLVVTPVQFRAVDTTKGWLRRFGQMVFEVTYADPSRAPANILGDTTPPLISDITIGQVTAARSFSASSVHPLSVIVTDTGGSGGAIDVTAFFTIDGVRWKSAALTRVSGNVYQGSLPTQLARSDVVAIIQARDSAGNVAVQSLKGQLSDAFSVVNLPTIMH
jgi:hypothetical protein